jgi:hypothetical protein
MQCLLFSFGHYLVCKHAAINIISSDLHSMTFRQCLNKSIIGFGGNIVEEEGF